MKPMTVLLAVAVSMVSFFVSQASSAGTIIKLQRGNIDIRQVSADSFSSHGAILSSTDVSGDYVIQFEDAIVESDKMALKKIGMQIFRYLPEDALIVRANSSMITAAQQQLASIRSVAPFQNQWKMSDALPVMSFFSKGQKDVFLISVFVESERARIEQLVLKLDPSAQILNSEERYITFYGNLLALHNISEIQGIEFIQKVEQMQPLHINLDDGVDQAAATAGDYTDLTGYETGTKVMNFDAAWGLGYHGEGQTVAMSDTGLDLGDATTISDDFKGAIKSGYFFGAGSKNWEDPMGHGTHVAGSVMGRGVYSGGKIRGGAYAANFIPESMWSPILDNLNVPAQLSKMFEPAYKDGARVHTNSWGAASNFGAYESMAQKVDEFMWNNPDFLILFAAGNSGTDKDKNGKIDYNSLGTPATAKNCLSVGASENLVSVGGIQKKVSELSIAKDNWPAEPIWSSKLSDNINGLAVFSSRGPTKDNRLKPDVVAPGTNILSTRSRQKSAQLLWGAYNDHYLWSGGTSMATPLAAGAAAVARQILVEKHKVANPSAALVKAVMVHTAFDMFPGQYGQGDSTQELALRPNNDEGYGRVDMDKLSHMESGSTIVDETVGIAQGDKKSYLVPVKKGQSILINLVYTDAPGTPTAGQALVNNIDVQLLNGTTVVQKSADTINNSEYMEIKNLNDGTYNIEVLGTKIPMGKNGKQPFALIYTVQ